jgi:nucleoid-associated protein YgaU
VPTLDEPAEDAPIEEVLAEADEPAAEPDAVLEALPDDISSPPAAKEKKTETVVARKTLLWIDFLFSWDYPSEPFDFDVILRDYANLLVYYAKVYILADCYAVIRLIEISCTKLY